MWYKVAAIFLVPKRGIRKCPEIGEQHWGGGTDMSVGRAVQCHISPGGPKGPADQAPRQAGTYTDS
jgi:hypothetical protein